MIVIGVGALERALRLFPDAALITIQKPGQLPSLIPASERLDLTLADVTLPIPGSEAATVHHIQTILRFVRKLQRQRMIIIHCTWGHSRSPAVAMVAQAARAGVTRRNLPELWQTEQVVRMPLDSVCFARDLGLRRDVDIKPNPWITALLDDLLRFEGRLLRGMFQNYWITPEEREEAEVLFPVLCSMACTQDEQARATVAERYNIPWNGISRMAF